jgi:predicted dehydrogenase
MRRFFDNNRLVKRIIESGTFGKVLRFHAEDAVLFERFNASPFTVIPPAGGVIYDTGTHILDLLLWWLGDFADIRYWDDRIAGVEANCYIEITTSLGVSGRVELSRTRNLENKINIVCQDGELELSTLNPTQLTIHSSIFSGPLCASKVVPETEIRQLVPYFAEQLSDFALAITKNRQPFVTGEEGMRNIAVIEHCIQNRQPLEVQPWAQLHTHIIPRISS